MKSKKTFILFITLFLLAGFLITSVTSYFVSLRSLRHEIKENSLPLTSDNIYSEIQNDLLQPVFISSLMAHDTFVRDWVLNGENNELLMRKYLHEIKTRYNAYTAFFVSDKTKIYYHANGILKKVTENNPRDNWYFRVRAMKPIYEINVDPDMANNNSMTIFINYKVLDYNGNYIGATGVGLTVGAVKKLIEEYQKTFNRNIYFVNTSGAVTLHSSSVLMPYKTLKEMPGYTDVYKKVLTSQDSAFRIKTKREIIHVNTRFIQELKWILIVEQKEGLVIKNIQNTLFINIAISLTISIIILSISYITLSIFQQRLEKLATTDKLTGAYNRTAFDIVIKQLIHGAQNNRGTFSVILFDLDYFKFINDSHGHLAGDSVLKEMVERTRNCIRESDSLFRWGGEEFIILLHNCPLSNAEIIAKKLLSSISGTNFHYFNKEIHVTASISVTSYTKDDTIDSIIARADTYLYEAKQNGRNCIVKEKKE